MASLYLDCSTGISGDMTVAALLDAGADENTLMEALDSVDAQGFSIKISRVTKGGLDCCDFDVILDHDHENFDHDMEYLYGDGVVDSSANNSVVSGPGHDHHESGDADHDRHHHEHRNLADVIAIIESSAAKESAKELAKKVFTILAESEAKAHETTVEEVHFHEVGAIDSIVDILAAAVCFDDLGISRVYVPLLSDGHGTVRCQHGIIPVPVPAVVNIAEKYHLPLSISDREGEFVTPTGAAFLAAVMTDTTLPDEITPLKTGYGAGKRDYEQPGILKAVIF